MNTFLSRAVPSVCALWFGLCSLAVEAALPTAAKAEVQVLLQRLETSGCRFNRNGTWYSASEAKAHLVRKLEYVENKNLANSVEQFIELAATKSSMTGTPYQVQCGQEKPQPSAVWFQQQRTQSSQ